MQTISQNAITQGQHGQYNAVDIGPYPDPYYYAPENGTITSFGDSGTCGLRLVLEGPTGRHGFCHNESALVKVGDVVKRGQKLAKMGYTGYTQPDDVPQGTHVHWVIYRNGVYVYPPTLINEPFIKLGGGTMTKDEAYKVTKWDYLHGTGIDPTSPQAESWANAMVSNPAKIDELGKYMLDQVDKRIKAAYDKGFKDGGSTGYETVTETLYRKK